MKLNILCVEDDIKQRENISELFSDCKIVFSDSGRDAIQNVKKQKFDLVLMDLGLKGRLGGVQTTQYLRRNIHLKIPIIAITGHEPVSAKFETEIAGCTDFLTKPYDISDLIALVKKHTNYGQESP